MTLLLASVQDEHEAQIALEGGAQIIDFKDTRTGALGALDPSVVTQSLQRLKGRIPTSATAGDCPLDPAVMVPAVMRAGATGVDYVKIGLLPWTNVERCVKALGPAATQYRIVAVFFADRGVSLNVLEHLRTAGFAGAMIDTFDKSSGGLRKHMGKRALRAFMQSARDLDLYTGLAGSLTADDIETLVTLSPHFLGFRGALCEGSERQAALSADRLRRVRAELERVQAQHPDACCLSPK
jgi:(5-formylfuran-3-yl)methyl phosphate synthase